VHGTAPAYLADSLQLTANVPARRRLRSIDSTMLQMPPTRRSTIGDRASGCGSSLEQSGASDKSRQLTTAVLARGKYTQSLLAVILTDQKQLLRCTIS